MKKIILFVILCVFVLGNVGLASAVVGEQSEHVKVVHETKAVGEASANNEGITVNNNFPEQKDLTTTRSMGHGFRDFPTPGSVAYPGTPSYFGHATPGSAFQSVKVILDYKDTFSVDELKIMVPHQYGIKVMTNALVTAVDEEEQANNLTVFIGKPSHRAKAVAFITVRATSERTSAELLAKAMLEARKYGAEAIQVTAEGVERQIEAFGWGIGFAYTSASINVAEDRGGVGTGGTGISGGHAGYKDKPWLRVVAIKFMP